MREMGIMAIFPGPNLSKRDLQHRIYPYLLRKLNINRPDHVWSVDITYIRMKHGWMYLYAIMDWYYRYIIDWQLDQTLEIEFVLETMRRALQRRQPEIINSMTHLNSSAVSKALSSFRFAFPSGVIPYRLYGLDTRKRTYVRHMIYNITERLIFS
jgi:transposase InsO family protein